MSKNVERAKNNEVLGIKGTKEELNELKKDIKLQNNFRLPEGDPENEKSLKDKLDNIIQLSEIGRFNNNGDFVVKESIKGKDDIGSYISIRGKKYYDDTTRSKIEDFRGLGYETGKFTDNTGYIRLGRVDGMILETGTEYFQDGKIYDGKWDLYNGSFKGIAKIPDNDGIRIYQGTFDGFVPKDGTLERYKDGNLKYTYKGNFHFFSPDGRGTMWWPNEDSYTQMYEGERKNGKYEGKGKYTFRNGNTYEGDRINGEKEGKGKYTFANGYIYECNRSNNKEQEGEGIITRPNGETYNGYLLINDNGKLTPFYEHDTLQKWREKQINSGTTTTQNLKGRYTLTNGSYHEYTYTNGSITEKSNDFITMYGDKRPDENWSTERGNIEYTINYHSASNIEYRLSSRKGREINWKFDGNNYVYKDIKGNALKISSSNFGEKEALHAANLINCIRYINEAKHGNGKYRYSKDNIYTTSITTRYYTSRGGYTYHEITTETNGTKLLEDITKHFGGINAGILATWLNNAKW